MNLPHIHLLDGANMSPNLSIGNQKTSNYIPVENSTTHRRGSIYKIQKGIGVIGSGRRRSSTSTFLSSQHKLEHLPITFSKNFVSKENITAMPFGEDCTTRFNKPFNHYNSKVIYDESIILKEKDGDYLDCYSVDGVCLQTTSKPESSIIFSPVDFKNSALSNNDFPNLGNGSPIFFTDSEEHQQQELLTVKNWLQKWSKDKKMNLLVHLTGLLDTKELSSFKQFITPPPQPPEQDVEFFYKKYPSIEEQLLNFSNLSQGLITNTISSSSTTEIATTGNLPFLCDTSLASDNLLSQKFKNVFILEQDSSMKSDDPNTLRVYPSECELHTPSPIDDGTGTTSIQHNVDVPLLKKSIFFHFIKHFCCRYFSMVKAA